MSVEPQIKYALTEDGVSVGYWTVGEGTPFIWPPGAVGSSSLRAWRTPEGRALIERVAARRMLVRYDSRGFGISQEGAVDVSLGARVWDLAAVVDRLGVEQVDLCGYLESGPTSLAYAAGHPERVAHLLLWCTTSRGVTFVDEDLERVLNELARVDYEIWKEAYVATVMRSFGIDASTQTYARSLVESFTAGVEFGDFVDPVKVDVTNLLADIRAPTLILHRRGIERPKMSDVQAMAARIPNVQLALLEGDAAVPYVGDTESVVTAIDEFLGGDAGAVIHGARQAPGGLVTVLFTDIVGHTEMMQRLGDARGREVLREHERITRDTLKQHGGAEVKTMGDGFMASFGSVTSAIECAMGLQRAFAAHTESMPEPLHVRVGLNAGEPIEEDGDLFGATVILASRIAAKAGAGEILVPEPVRHLLSGKTFTFSDRGEYEMKGFDDAVRLYEVLWQE
jgi:class 3 adenylate cyclase